MADEEFSQEEQTLIEKIVKEVDEKTSRSINLLLGQAIAANIAKALANNEMSIESARYIVTVMLPEESRPLLTKKVLEELDRLLTVERDWLLAEFKILDSAGNGDFALQIELTEL